MKIDFKKFDDKTFIESQTAAFAEVQNDQVFMEHLKALNITDELITKNIAPIVAYYESYLSVLDCTKARICVNEESYHAMSLEVQGDFLFINYELCPMVAAKEVRASRYAYIDFPSEYIDTAKKLAKRASQNDYNVALGELITNKINTVYVYGNHGVGKLTLAIRAVNRVLEENEEYVAGVIDFRTFVSEHSSDYYSNKNSATAALEKLLNVDILIVRNFGNEESNKLTRDVFSFPLVSERIRNNRKTIFISDVNIDDLQGLYDPTWRDVRIKQLVEMLKSNAREVFVGGVKI